MATRHSHPGALLIGVTNDRRKTVASFVKTKTAFGMAPGDTYAHSFDELRAFYACEDETLTEAAAPRLPLPGSFHIRNVTFRRFISPLISLIDVAYHRRLIALFWGLSLHREQNLALAMARLIAADKGVHSLAWCTFCAKVRPNRRSVFITLLAETGLGHARFTTEAGDFFLSFETLTTRTNYAAWLYTACTGILQGIDLDYLLGGFHIAAKFSPWLAFGRLGNCNDFRPGDFQGLIDRLQNSRSFYSRLPITVWEACGELPGFNRLVAQVDWSRLRPAQARKFVHMMYALMYEDLPRPKMLDKWRIFARQFAAIIEVIYAVPQPYKNKAIDFFEEYYWRFDDAGLIEKYHANFCRLIRLICRVPFSKEDILATLWCTLLECGEIPHAQVLLRIERFCRSKNSVWLVVRGIRALRKIFPAYAGQLWQTGNPRLLYIACLLGSLGRKQRYDVLLAFRSSEIVRLEVSGQNIREALHAMDKFRDGSLHNPVPRKLKAYIQGEISLSEKALCGQITRLNANLQHFKLHLLEHRIRTSVHDHYALREPKYDHALFITNLIQENRRELRQFLTAHAAGDDGYVMRHAATQRWLAQATVLNLNFALRGFEMLVEDEAVGTIRLACENDPLEKLKLGTYVGSCLGLGGRFAFSAAAVLLDINKYVIYARDRRGRVVARQLICISDDGKLVPFLVYPVDTTATMQAHFAEFDRRFAAALGIACHETGDDGNYTISNIISREWWDDGAWDMRIEE